jgi:hypothetical protein
VALICAREVQAEILRFFELQHSLQLASPEILKACILLVKTFDLEKILGKSTAPKCAFLKASKFKQTAEVVKELQKKLPIEIKDTQAINQLKQLASTLDWVSDFNIGNIMHMKPIPPYFFSADSFKKLLNHDSIMEIVSNSSIWAIDS